MKIRTPKVRLAAVALVSLASMGAAHAVGVTVTIENLAPVNGNFLTPVWVGFHDGSFDTFTVGQSAAGFLEAIAEDGNTAPVAAAFTGAAQATIPGPNGPLAPGDVATFTFDLDTDDPDNRYFSFLSMVLPSNDAFIGNDDPTRFQLFDINGVAQAIDFFIAGSMIYDAGTEVNDEIPANTAFFGQAMPNTGVDEGGVVGFHPGFLPFGSGGILDDPMFANADFTRAGYPVAQIRVSVVPLPGAVWLMLTGLTGLLGFARRRA